MHTNKTRHSFNPSRGQADVQPSPESRAPSCVQWPPGKTSTNIPNVPRSTKLFLEFCELSMMPHGVGYPLGQQRPVSQLCPPTFLTCWWGEVRGRKDLTGVQTLLSVNENITALSTQLSAQMQNMAPYQLL